MKHSFENGAFALVHPSYGLPVKGKSGPEPSPSTGEGWIGVRAYRSENRLWHRFDFHPLRANSSTNGIVNANELVPSGNVASTCISWSISEMPSMT